MNRGQELRLRIASRDTRSAGERVLAAVRAGKTAALPELLAAMGPVERRACLPELKELRGQLRADWSQDSQRVRAALLVAGAGCHTAPAAAASWIGANDIGGWAGLETPGLTEVIGQQPADWQAAVVTRLAGRRGAAWGWRDYPVLERLVRAAGCPVPTTDAFVEGWLRDRTWGASGNRRRGSLLDLLRTDDLLPVLLPRLFELADVGDLAAQPNRAPEDGWPGALAALAREGGLDRADLIARCTARLLRGGKPGDQRAFLAVLEALAPAPEEHAVHARSHLAMLDGLSSVAGHAQRVLADLDERGLVEPELLGEASEAVLFRTEKKLVRAQLGWLDRAARRDPARSGPVVLAATGAFGHPDTALQERALNVVARHLPVAGPAVLPELREAAGALNPVHHARAAGLLGADLALPEAAPADRLPPVAQSQPLAAPIATPAEVAEELSVVLAGGADVPTFERALDGLVRHAHRDREALVDALQPVLGAHPWSGVGRWSDCGPQDLLFVAAAVAGLVPPHRLWDGLGVRNSRSPLRSHAGNTAFGRWFAVRLEEAAWQVTATRPPLLLAVPTVASGSLEAAELVARLAEYEAADVAPGSADLSCALLRVAPTEDRAVLAAADRLVSPAGRWAAAWLRAGGLPDQPSERVRFAPGGGGEPVYRFLDRWWERSDRIEVAQPGPRVPVGPAGEQPVAECLDLLAATGPSVQRARVQAEWNWVPTPHWLAALPHHREELAARLLDGFAGAADRDALGAPQLLPQLAEAGGPAGIAVHLALAYGLAARHQVDRTAAVDALLVLAARGQLDGGLLGAELAVSAGAGAVKVSRLASALAEAAGTGAYGTVWAVLAGALPGLLAGEPARGSGELLAVAADCARRTGARGAVAEVTAVAGRGGSSRLVREARALREVLGEG